MHLVCFYVCSLNGEIWLPSESSVICSEHFLEIKSFDDPSFIPDLFPGEIADSMSSRLQVPENRKQGMEKDILRDFGTLQKVVDRADRGGAGRARGRVDTSQLQEAFRELACHVCQLLVAHDSELLIEGTVGVTVDGGSRVMLLHFSDQVRKTEASNIEENVQNPVSEHIPESAVFHDVAKNSSKDGTVNKVQTSIRSSEEKTPAVRSADCSVKPPSVSANSSQHSTASLKILSDLAQQTAATMCTSSGMQTDAAGLSMHKRKAETDISVCDKPKQQTLLRELLCAPLPPKRPCRPVIAAPSAATTSIIGAVRQHRPTPNSAVLGGLLRTRSYGHDLNSRPVTSMYGNSREMRFKPESGTATQGGYGIPQQGVDVNSPQFGGNAVRALLRLASEHAATGRHDLLRDNKRRESAASQNESSTNDGSLDASLDRRYNVLYQNLVGSDIGSPSAESVSTNQNTAKSDSSTTVCSSSEYAPSTVKQEIVDPGYE